jgi:hypothetical protein
LIPAKLQTGDYAEFLDGNSIRIFDKNGAQKQIVPMSPSVPLLKSGTDQLRLQAETSAPVKLTLITLGAAEKVEAVKRTVLRK